MRARRGDRLDCGRCDPSIETAQVCRRKSASPPPLISHVQHIKYSSATRPSL